MSDNAELQAKIAALSGRVEQAKQQASPPSYAPYSHHHQPYPNYRAGYRGRGHGRGRWSPYGGASSRYPATIHQNNSLVINNSGTTTPVGSGSSKQKPINNASSGSPAERYVAEQFRGNKQLINTKIYEERQQQKLKAMEMTAKKHLQARNQKEQTRLAQHFQGQVGATVGAPREMIISDLRFRLTDDGSKLIRIFGALLTNLQAAGSAAELSFADGNTSVEATPKQAKIVGVTFRRTKHGNLVRDGIVKEKRYRIWTGAAEEVADPYIATCRPPKVKKSTQLCPKFSNYGTSLPYQQRTGGARKKTTNRTAPTAYSAGTCPFGDRCKLTHDFNKLAICKDYLRSGECPAGDACDLSHDPTPHRVPMCMYFLRGECTNEHCRYAHVRHDINPAAPVCRAFVTLGYCDKGAQCTERHVIECPDYANTGRCRKPEGECRLPHVDRAGVLRKAAAKKARKGSDEDSDLSSDEGNYDEIDQDDVDSDGLDDEDVAMGGSDDDSHQLTQQQDFIAFS